MNKDEALSRLATIEKESAELRKIIEEKDKPDPRMGKLCWYGDEEPLRHMAILEEITDDGQFMMKYRLCEWAVIRPVTRAELAGLFVEDDKPFNQEREDFIKSCYADKPSTRYDWTRPDVPKEAKYWTTDGNGRQDTWLVAPSKGAATWDAYFPAIAKVMIRASDAQPCPDWADSLEERPEGV